jgi:anaerobic selenocysteine-containing dehydrogenase
VFDTRGFGDVMLALGAQLGSPVREALPWRTLKDAIREAADDLRRMNRGSFTDTDPDRFWLKLLQRGGWWDQGSSGTASGVQTAAAPQVQPARFDGSSTEFPFHLVVFPHNTLGAGESAHLPWLQAAPDPVTTAVWQTWVEVNPRVASQMQLGIGDIVEVQSSVGRVEVPVYIHPAAPPDVLAMPLGQGHTAYGRWAQGRGANPLSLLAPLTDGATGAMAYGATRVRMRKTGRSIELPKLEGTELAVQMPHFDVAKVTRDS